MLTTNETIKMIKHLCLATLLLSGISLNAQTKDTINTETDTIRSEMIDEVVVNAVRKLTKESVDKTIVTVKGQQIFEGDNTVTILSKIQGVAVIGDRILYDGIEVGSLRVNNRRMNFSSQKEVMNYLRNLDNKGIKELEIVNQSARHSASGTGKILNINLDEPTIDGLSANPRFNYSQGIVADKDLNMFTQIKKGKLSSNVFLYYGINKDYRDESNTNTYWEIEEVQNQHNNMVRNVTPINANVDLQYNFDSKMHIGGGIQYNGMTVDENTESIISLRNNGSLESESNITNSLDIRGNYTTATLYFNRKLDTLGQNIRAEINYNIYDFNNEQFLRNNTDPNDPEFRQQITRRTYLPNVALDYDRKVLKGIDFSAGILYYHMDIHEDRVSSGQSNIFEYAENVFAQYISFLGKSKFFDYQVGVRGEATSNTFNNYYNVFPSLSLRKTVGPVNIQLNLNRSITRPAGFMLSPNLVYVNPYLATLGDPQLRPTLRDQVSGTVSFKSWRLSASYNDYKNQINNIQVIDDTDERLVLNQYVNLGDRAQTDFSLSYGYRSKKLMLTPMISYMTGRFRLTDEGESMRNNFSYFNLTSSYSITRTDRIDGGFRYYFTNKILFNTVRPSHSLDLTYNKSLLKNKLNVQLFAKDLLRGDVQRFSNVLPYFQSIGEQYADSRQVGISIRYSFQTGENVNVEGSKSNINRK